MKTNILNLMAAALLCTGLAACGDKSSKTFDTIYEMIDEAQRLYKEEGLQQVRDYEEQFWAQHPQKSLTFAVEVEEDIPLEVKEFWFEGANSNILNNAIRIATIAKKTGDGSVENINLVFYKDDLPVHIIRLDNHPQGNDEIALWGNFKFDIKDGKIPPYERTFNRIVVTRKTFESWEVNQAKQQLALELEQANNKNALKLRSRIDTLSYALGVSQSDGLLPYVKEKYNVDQSDIDDFVQGLTNQKGTGTGEKQIAVYKVGTEIGDFVSSSMIPNINKELFGERSQKGISKDIFMEGFVSGVTGKNQLMTLDWAKSVSQKLMRAVKEEESLTVYGDNKSAGEQFLAANAKKEGIKTLPSGVQYRVIKAGKGPIPTSTQMVKVHYKGSTVDGREFDNSYNKGKPVEFRCNQVIQGLTDALTHMPVGSTWEVCIPQELAYGNRQQGDIKPFSALVFTVELIDIVK